MQKLFILLLLALANVSFASAEVDLTEYINDTYDGKADTLEYCFIENFLNKDKGTFWSTPQDVSGSSWNCYWQQAHAIDVLIYAYERIKDTDTSRATKYKTYIRKWYNNHANNYYGSTFENPFTDDMAWICLTLLHISDALGSDTYRSTAKNVFDNYIMPRLEIDADGNYYLPWNTDKNADGTWANPDGGTCTDGPVCLIAARLYELYGDDKYLEDSKKFYAHMINTHCYSDGRVGEPPLSYTNGTFGEACRRLYHITGESEYKTKAALFIYYAFNSTRNTTNGVLRNEGENNDNSLFKAVLMPYACNFVLDDSMTKVKRKQVLQLILKNADSLWSHLDKSQYPNIYCPYCWGEDYDYTSETPASMGAMASGASLFENTTRMCETLIAEKEASGINAINVGSSCDKAYDIQGRKADASYKGIVIKNGKKYLNK